MRSGTLNVPAIVGFGKACTIAVAEQPEEGLRLFRLREHLREAIQSRLEETHVNGSLEHRLPGNLNLSFDGIDGQSLLTEIEEEIAVSSGSACISALLEPSYVLRALGVSNDLADASIRFGLGRFNTIEEIEYAAQQVVDAIERLRQLPPSHKCKA
jgi:cysteine desulfurase